MPPDMPTQPEPLRSSRRGAERRQHPRVRGDCPLSMRVGDERVEVRLRDLSSAGVCFFHDRPVREMTVVELALELPDSHGVRTIVARGAVVRCQPISPRVEHYEVAVFLHDVRDDDRRALTRWVEAEAARRALGREAEFRA